MALIKATRKASKLRLALSGLSGSGKTFTALMLAKALGGKVIKVLDSETGSASKYAGSTDKPGEWDFYAENLEGKRPQDYVEAIKTAGADGVDVLIIDSYSHSWLAALEMVDLMGGSKMTNGWKNVSPEVQKLVDAVLSFPGHVIATMRTKAAYDFEKGADGKINPKKIGMATVARDGTDYEFDVMLEITREGISVSKSRCPGLDNTVWGRTPSDVARVASKLAAWLNEGAPETELDKVTAAIRGTTSEAELVALVPRIKELSEADRKALSSIYLAKKQTFASAPEAQ